MVNRYYESKTLVFQIQTSKVNLKVPYIGGLTKLEVADPDQVNASHPRSKKQCAP